MPLAIGSTFVLATGGVYEHVSEPEMLRLIDAHASDLDLAAQRIVRAA